MSANEAAERLRRFLDTTGAVKARITTNDLLDAALAHERSAADIRHHEDFCLDDDRSAGAAPLDVERLTVILWEAENDDQLGVEYEPRRLAEYILVRLSERTDR